MNVIAGTITSSPGSRPAILQAISKPAVALVRNTACLQPRYLQASASTRLTSSPRESFVAVRPSSHRAATACLTSASRCRQAVRRPALGGTRNSTVRITSAICMASPTADHGTRVSPVS